MSGHSFANVIQKCRHPGTWETHVSALDGSFETILGFPTDVDLRAFLEPHVPGPGRYKLSLRRIDDGSTSEGTLKSARSRLRKHGPLDTVVEIGGKPLFQTVPMPDDGGGSTRKGATFTMPDPEDQELQRIARETQRSRLEAQRIQAQLNLAKAERDFEATQQRQEAGGAAPAVDLFAIQRLIRDEIRDSRPPQTAQSLSWVAPIVTALLTSLIDSSSKREAMLLEILGQKPEQSDSVATTLPLMKQLLELAKELGAGEGEPTMVGEVARLIGSLHTLTGTHTHTPPALPNRQTTPNLVQRAPDQQQQKQNAMRLQVLNFLATIKEYSEHGADPLAVAEELERPFLLLPRAFRELVLQNGVDGVISGLVRFMPQSIFRAFTAGLQQSSERKTWLAAFIEAMQDSLVDEPAAAAAASAAAPAAESFRQERASPWSPNGPAPAPAPDIFGVNAGRKASG